MTWYDWVLASFAYALIGLGAMGICAWILGSNIQTELKVKRDYGSTYIHMKEAHDDEWEAFWQIMGALAILLWPLQVVALIVCCIITLPISTCVRVWESVKEASRAAKIKERNAKLLIELEELEAKKELFDDDKAKMKFLRELLGVAEQARPVNSLS